MDAHTCHVDPSIFGTRIRRSPARCIATPSVADPGMLQQCHSSRSHASSAIWTRRPGARSPYQSWRSWQIKHELMYCRPGLEQAIARKSKLKMALAPCPFSLGMRICDSGGNWHSDLVLNPSCPNGQNPFFGRELQYTGSQTVGNYTNRARCLSGLCGPISGILQDGRRTRIVHHGSNEYSRACTSYGCP